MGEKKKVKGFIKIPIHHLVEREVKLDTIVLYHYLKFRANHKKKCWQYVKTITEETGISRSRFFKCMRELEDKGWITRESRQEKGQSSVYRVPEKSTPETTLVHAVDDPCPRQRPPLSTAETRGVDDSTSNIDEIATIFDPEKKNRKEKKKRKIENNNNAICNSAENQSTSSPPAVGTSSTDFANAQSVSDVDIELKRLEEELQITQDMYTNTDSINEKGNLINKIINLDMQIKEMKNPVNKNINIDERKRKLEEKAKW